MTETDYSQRGDISIPDEPGPTVLDKTPLIGSVRRSMDLPVLRDELDGFGR